MQLFGISVSITVPVVIWFLSATIVHCSHVSDDSLGSKLVCKQDSLANYLIVTKKWPYQHIPFLGYWDSYGNKLAIIIEEPYSRLFVTLAMVYLIWLRIVIYARGRRHTRPANIGHIDL
jgi:hypothetical protein